MDRVHIRLSKYTTEDFTLTLPFLNPDKTPYTLPVNTQASCMFTRKTGAGLNTFIFKTTPAVGQGTITVVDNTLMMAADHTLMANIIGDYEAEVLVRFPDSGAESVSYILHLESKLANTPNPW